MKTNVLVLFAFLIAITSCNSVEKVTSADIEIKTVDLQDFNSIEVSSGLDVKLYPSNENRVKISSNVLKYIKVEVNDEGALKIYREMPKGPYMDIKSKSFIEVWAKNVEVFKSNSSANLDIMGSFPAAEQTVIASSSGDVNYVNVQCEVLKLKASSSGDIEGKVDTNELYAKASSSGDIEIKGSATKADLTASSSGDIEAEKLNADYVTVDASSSGDIYITVNKEIKGKVSSSADLYYRADKPINIDVKKSSSGEIIRID